MRLGGFVWFAISVACIGTHNASASEPIVWSGQTRWHDASIAFEITDRDGNCRAGDDADRLRLDLDGDGKLHPLTEQFACKPVLRIAGKRYTLGLEPIFDESETSDPQREQSVAPENAAASQNAETPTPTGYRLMIQPLRGTGFFTAKIDGLNENSTIENVSATLVSQGGVHVAIDRVNSEIEVPVGTYRVEQLTIATKDDRHWKMSFAKTSGSAEQTVSVIDGQRAEFDVLGKLTLDAHLVAKIGSSRISVSPSMTTSTGLYLVLATVGQTRPQDEIRLTASVVDMKPGGEREVKAISGTGFACGAFCPITFPEGSPMTPTSVVVLQFDAGPLGGPMIRVVKPGGSKVQTTADESMIDALDLD